MNKQPKSKDLAEIIAPSKKCFVIAPIGSKGSETRDRSDKILRHIIRPIAEENGYSVVRADEINEPGVITTQIIKHILEDQLVIADLTEHNPNVFYELAIRHLIRKPVIHLIQSESEIPFDVMMSRTIFIDHTNLDSVEEGKSCLKSQIATLEHSPFEFDSPISNAIDRIDLKKREEAKDVSVSDILLLLEDVRKEILDVKKRVNTEFLPESFNPYQIPKFEPKLEPVVIPSFTFSDGLSLTKPTVTSPST